MTQRPAVFSKLSYASPQTYTVLISVQLKSIKPLIHVVKSGFVDVTCTFYITLTSNKLLPTTCTN